jgi:hypothetical protein
MVLLNHVGGSVQFSVGGVGEFKVLTVYLDHYTPS